MLGSQTVVGVCGAGAMGAGIAQVAAQAGHRTLVFDLDETALGRGRKGVESSLAAVVKRGKLTEEAAQATLARMEWTTDIGKLSVAGLVIEAIVEKLSVKQELFKRLEAVVGVDAILATNTSSLSVSDIAAGLAHPRRFMGLHFFNPAPIMKLVEVPSGTATDPALAADALALMQRWGKVAIAVRDVPGFIVNRVARPYYAEGWRALDEQAADAATLDFLYRDLGGFRMGPLELGDVIGHDINSAAARTVFEAYGGKVRFVLPAGQLEFVKQGRLGRKSGRGVYDYSSGSITDTPRFSESAGSAASEHVLVHSSDGRSARRMAADTGRSVVVLDHAFNKDATSIAFAASDDTARQAALNFAAGSGKKVVELADRPGLVVFRTLLQLVNAAADAVTDEVATPDGIDLAMMNGVNYPFGLLAWARAYADKVAPALDHIAEETGEAMYRPNTWLRDRKGAAA